MLTQEQMNEMMAETMKVTNDARARTGRNVALAINKGKFMVVDWTGVKMNGSNDGKHLTDWTTREKALDFMRSM